MSIPASNIVQVNPGVLTAGGAALVANGLILSQDPATPIGQVLAFSNASDVGSFYGPASPEATYAGIYFRGFNNATLLPANLLISQYPIAPVAGFVRTGKVSGLTLAQLQALSGTLIVTVGGVLKTSTAINLSSATSFSNAATLMLAQFTTPGFTITYDSQRGAFLFTSSTPGVTGTMSYLSGTLAAGILGTQALGATLGAGSAAAVPATYMEALVAVTQNWVSFMTVQEPILADKIAFAQWLVSKNNRYVYACWDTDANAIVPGNLTSFGAVCKATPYSGVAAIYQDPMVAAFLLGAIASTDFSRTNGRPTYAFKGLTGLVASVTDGTTANTLEANGYDFYGAYATANQGFVFFYPGQIAGQYLWIDAYVNQIWLNNALQLALLSLLTSVVSIPYNPQGYALIDAACMDPILAALNFGAIRNNVPLSQSQAAQVNSAAGVVISDTLASRGWYLQIKAATAQVRAARGSPPMTLWYCDGGAVQRLVLASIMVQ